MFYRPEAGHGLPHDPFSAIVAPRPIGWISTRGTKGDNIAPYSFFNAVAYKPPQVMFASTGSKPDREGTKDSVAQIAETGVFCVNIVSGPMIHAMNATSAALPADESEFDLTDLARAECETIDCPRIKDAPAVLECRALRILPLAGEMNQMVIGTVTGVHLRPDCVKDGRFDLSHEGWLSRLGYRDYANITDLFELERP